MTCVDSGTRSATSWADRLKTGGRQDIARAITAVENETADALAVMRGIHSIIGRAHVIGLTGPPGAGKSTLVSALIGEFRERGFTVGVIAVDPSSTFSGGAILGDRIRMLAHSNDDGVFIRSLASRGRLGGLSENAGRVIDVLDAAGKDIIIVETVGAGQSEIEIAEIAHTRIVVAAPGLGDDIQAFKAGIFEIADILVVNKCDLPYAERTANDLLQMLKLRRREHQDVPVLKTNASNGDGIVHLCDQIVERGRCANVERINLGRERMKRQLVTAATKDFQRRLTALHDPRLDTLCDRLLKAAINLDDAVAMVYSFIKNAR